MSDITGNVKDQFKGFLSTKNLWQDDSLFGISQFCIPKSKNDSLIDPKNFIPGLESKSVLGKRAENFFELAINASENFEILLANLQISREKITIGEIDFLLKNLTANKIIHVELVYKFYIYDDSFSEELKRWIGPNRKDSLLRKIDRLKNHQLPLLYRKETLSKLEDLGINIKDAEQEVCFMANLFLPKKLMGKEIPLVNNKCITGYWIYYQDFLLEEYTANIFYTPKKQDWPIAPEYNSKWFPYSVIKEQIADFIKEKRSPLMWMKTPEGNHERFFIVWW